MDSCPRLYLDLLRRSLTNTIYAEKEVIPVPPNTPLKRLLIRIAGMRGIQLVHPKPLDLEARAEGKDWPLYGQTMLSNRRLDNVQRCVETVLEESIPGDLIETGVWRGGAAILMRGVLKAYGETQRTVWVADSFAGLPPPDPNVPQDASIPYHTFHELAVSLEQVQANFERYGLLDDQVRFLKGWFKDTLPTAPVEHLAVMRLDGDMYESTMDGLTALYPKLSPGGFAIIDDYGMLEPCRQAVTDYREQHGIEEPILTIDFAGAYWRKTG